MEVRTGEPYYWEEGGNPNPPLTTYVGHNVYWLGSQLFSSVEYVGSIFAEFFGLYNSRYEWAVDMQRRREVSAVQGRGENRGEERRMPAPFLLSIHRRPSHLLASFPPLALFSAGGDGRGGETGGATKEVGLLAEAARGGEAARHAAIARRRREQCSSTC